MKFSSILLALLVLTSCDFSPDVIVQKEIHIEAPEFADSFFFADEEFMGLVAAELDDAGIQFDVNEDGSISYRPEDRSIVQTIGDRLVSERYNR